MWIITGASGFVGRHLIAAIPGSRGLDRRRLRAWTTENLCRELEGASGVVHAAAVVHRPGAPSEEYRRFNVDGTRILLDAAEQAGVRRIVFLSSIKVYGEAPPSPIDETTPMHPEAAYAVTKLEAERLVLERSACNPIVLRLCPVYGRGDKGNVRTMISAIHRRRFFVPGDGSTRKSIVHVSTVADVVRAATEQTRGGAFVVADEHAPSIRELSDKIALALGRRRPLGVPRVVLRASAGLVERAARLARVQTAVSAKLVDKAMTSSVCDPSKVTRELGVRCSVDLDAALRDEIAWLRVSGAL